MATRLKANELNLTPMQLEKFSWDKTTGELVAEASDFGPLVAGMWWMGQLRNDACDVGIALRSHFTGNEERFALREGKGIEDGERLYWEFIPVKRDSKVKKVTILND